MRVAELWRYPVKSLAGERLERAEVLADGLRGDRLVRVDDGRRPITARRRHRLIGIGTGVGPDGEPLVDGERWDSAAAAALIRRVGGERAALVSTSTGKRFDAAPILVTTDGALHELGEDRRRFRPNLVLAGVEGRAERCWVGRRLRVGEVMLAAREVCERCAVTTIDPDTLEIDPEVLRRVNDELDGIMGVYCEVVEPGTIAVGDRVGVL